MPSKLYFSTIPRNRMDMVIEKTSGYGSGRCHSVISGILNPGEYMSIKEEVIEQLMLSLFIHDELYIDIDRVGVLGKILGYENLIELIKNDVIKIINDEGIKPVVIKEKDNWTMSFNGQNNFEENFVRELVAFEKYESKIADKLAFHVFTNPVYLPYKELHPKLFKECQFDSNNRIIEEYLSDKLISIDDQINRVIRMNEVNKALIVGSELNVSNITLDSNSKLYLRMKISNNMPLVQTGKIQDIFKHICNLKRIPNIAPMFIEGSIGIGDILELRSKSEAKRFRKWLFSTNYSDDEFYEKLMENKKIKDNVKNIKWAAINAISFVDSVAGLGLSAIDSFIIEKLLNGWSPNLFIDEVYGKKLKELEYIMTKKTNYRRVIKAYPQLGRNDKCPCGNNKKFKKCCGRIEFQ